MTDALSTQLLNLACGAFLIAAVLVLWRRQLTVTIRVLAFQGVALAGIVAVLAAQQRSAELAAVAVGVLGLRAGALPWLLRRAPADPAPLQRESRPLIGVAASLLAAAGLVVVAYAVSAPLVALAPAPATRAVPLALAVVLIGFLVLVSQRRALSHLLGFLLVDNGITAIGFLTTAGVPLVVELGVSLDVLLAVLVLQILATRMRDTFGGTDLGELRELRD